MAPFTQQTESFSLSGRLVSAELGGEPQDSTITGFIEGGARTGEEGHEAEQAKAAAAGTQPVIVLTERPAKRPAKQRVSAELFAAIDVDQSGAITRDEFVAAFLPIDADHKPILEWWETLAPAAANCDKAAFARWAAAYPAQFEAAKQMAENGDRSKKLICIFCIFA